MTSIFQRTPSLALATVLSVFLSAPAVAQQPEVPPAAVQLTEQQNVLTLPSAISQALKNAPVLHASTARAAAAVAARR